MDSQSKKHVDEFVHSCFHTLTIQLECGICGENTEFDIHDEDEVPSAFYSNCAEQAYKEGWRHTTSEVFGLVGAICPECLPHKDDHTYHEENSWNTTNN